MKILPMGLGLLWAVLGGVSAIAAEPKLTPELEAQFKAYLMKNPEVIIESLQNFQEKSQKEALAGRDEIIQKSKETLYNDGYSAVINPQGTVNMVAFLDHRCGYCKKNWPVVEELLKSRPQVRLVLKEFPILGEQSLVLSRLALAAPAEKRVEYFRALMAIDGGTTSEKALEAAKKLGLDEALLKKNSESPQVSGVLEKTRSVAESLGLSGTPMYIIGDHVVEGGRTLEDFQKLVDAASSGKESAPEKKQEKK